MAITEQPEFEQLPTTHLPRSTGACAAERGVCRVHGAQFASMQASHAAEVSALRRRIAALEAGLAQAEAARAAEVAVADQPLVTSINEATDRSETDGAAKLYEELTANASNITTGAAAWDDGDATFSERIAALAFFREDNSEEPARRWFLRNT